MNVSVVMVSVGISMTSVGPKGVSGPIDPETAGWIG